MSNEMDVYKAPLGANGKPCWVPIVVKNRDSLKAFIDALHFTASFTELKPSLFMYALSSDRFNNILKNNIPASEMSKSEVREYVKSIIIEQEEESNNSNVECSYGVLDDYYLTVNCTCGNFYGFNTPFDIPEKQLNCDICGNVVIDYLNRDDEEFMYDGEFVDIQKVVEQVKKEMDNEN